MHDLKKKVLGDLRGYLDDRMASRLKPKPPTHPLDDGMGKPPMPTDSEDEHEAPEMPGEKPDAEDMAEGPEGIKEEGGDISKLNPEERQELARLYEKMGC